MTPGLLLTVAIALEVAATLSLRAAAGFTKLGPSLVVIGGYGGATILLTVIVRYLPISVTYAIWSAVGTAVIALIGMTVLSEPVTHLKVLSLAFVIVGIVGLNLAGTEH